MKPFPQYSFLAEAAAEAREASRRYWQNGGEADLKWPVRDHKGWYIPLIDDPQKQVEASLKRHRGERK